jgi:hypothetical protein
LLLFLHGINKHDIAALVRKSPERDEKSISDRLMSLGATKVAFAIEEIDEKSVDIALDARNSNVFETEYDVNPLRFLREWGSYVTLNSPLVLSSDSASNALCGLARGVITGASQALNAFVYQHARLHYGLYQPSPFAFDVLEDVTSVKRMITPVVDRVFSIDDLESAFSYFEEKRGIFGKVAIDVSSEKFEESRKGERT